MTTNKHVPLARSFFPLQRTKEDAESHEIMTLAAGQESTGWETLERCYRCVILAGAGVGKTHEMNARAELVRESGRTAFFIRIEDIDQDFELAFEVGGAADFQRWLSSTDEAWFFLDSVDEARLSDPRMFEKAVRRFADRIRNAQHRARVFVSSRPYAWRSHSDYVMLCRYLPFVRPKRKPTEDDAIANPVVSQDRGSEEESGLDVYVLDDLAEDDIRTFAAHRGAENVEGLLDEIRRKNLFAVASRPFDLEGILEKWNDDGELGGRLELLRHGIDKRIVEIDPARAQQQPLNRERGRKGARLLAAAVVLTGDAGIRVPDKRPSQDGIDAETVLGEWDPREVNTLLERGIFDDAIYSMVRFRHREVRELLAAEWLGDHLQNGNSRQAVEALLFREKYGHRFIAPRLRPLLPWLILFDEDIRRKVLAISPETAIEGGDIALLALSERRQLLEDIVGRIAVNEGAKSARDNEAIARIAQGDLTEDVLRLIDEHRGNDEVLFFLNRLVWQGELVGCLSAMMNVATDQASGRYARIAATRAVVSVGPKQKSDELWDALLNQEETINPRILTEIVQQAAPNNESVRRLLASVEKTPPLSRFQGSGFIGALHQYIDRFNVETSHEEGAIASLLSGLNGLLGRSPHLEGGRVRLSQDFAWLLSVASKAAERLIAARAPSAFNAETMGVLQKVSAAVFWQHDIELREHSQRLGERVREWAELHDAFFWACIQAEREHSETTTGEQVTEGWRVLSRSFCLRFDASDFDRVLSFINQRPLEDDKLVVVWLAYRLVRDLNMPPSAIDALHSTVRGQSTLERRLKALMSAKPSKKLRAMEAREKKHRLKHERKQRIESEYRKRWIAGLQANPDLVGRPDTVEPGQITNNQRWLMAEIKESNNSRWKGDDWRSLISTFGKSVAEAYRDAAISHWREFTPPLLSEGYDDPRVPWTLIFGLVGLEIEASEVSEFPTNLSEEELTLAMRYATWELSGFPTWLHAAYRDRPQLVRDALISELRWDLGRDEAPRQYMLHDIVYHAPWLHEHIGEWLVEWLETNTVRDVETLRQALYLAKSCADANLFAGLAREKIATCTKMPIKAKWFALWVDTNAGTGIPALRDWLGTLSPEDSSLAAQHFVAELVGDHRGADLATGFESYLTAAQLKCLYVLMHQYIRVEDDIERIGGGAYSPGLRDNAQSARNSLIHLLAEQPGKATFLALRELAEDDPDQTVGPWIMWKAATRAEQDGDLEPFSATQVREFDANQTVTPSTNKQLFDLTVERLIDMRAWLEKGDDSPYETWKRVPAETEMRNLVAGRLNDRAIGRYTCAQENEMPNSQRPDIWVQSPNVPAPVPIELKLLDNGWTGPDLCERLRNQLAGDYLRAEAAGAGVMLLIWQGRAKGRSWDIGGRRVPLLELETVLQDYWHSISNDWPDVDEVRVIVINLTKRGRISET